MGLSQCLPSYLPNNIMGLVYKITATDRQYFFDIGREREKDREERERVYNHVGLCHRERAKGREILKPGGRIHK